MTTTDYEREVFTIVEDLREWRDKCGDRFRYSDIFDAEGHQYVNLVQEGGGVLGIALVGFTYVLEEMGIRFLSLGGTSAGSINTLLLADAGKPAERKSVKILDRIATKSFGDFVDGGRDAEQLTRLLKNMMEKGGGGDNYLQRLGATIEAVGNVPELFKAFGINPGLHFEEWLREVLEYDNWQSLEANLRELPDSLYHLSNNGKRRIPLTAEEVNPRIAIMAADITTQTKVELPRMAELYYENPEECHPAEFVRASMSIPFFFEPQRVSLAWAAGREEEARRNWKQLAGFRGNLPEEVLLVDGGIMSNFPIDVFHEADTIPQRPTIGVKLGADRNEVKTVRNLSGFLGSMGEGVRNLRDFEFIRNNPEYRDLVEYIDVEGFNWIDFQISEEKKLQLFRRGAEAARNFLHRFDWAEYKNGIKRNLLRRMKPLMWELSDLRDLSDTLEVLGIREDEALETKIEAIGKRAQPFNVLWIDDAFIYALPLAILDLLNTKCETVRSSDAALNLLVCANKESNDPHDMIHLIISDVTRREEKGDDKLRGLNFAALLANDPDWQDIPVIFYAHDRRDLEERYAKPLPPNVYNRPGKNTMLHRDFIDEVASALTDALPATA